MTAPASRSAIAPAAAVVADAAIPLAERPIEIVVEPPGPRARERIEHEKPFVSPSLIYCYPLFVRRASGCMVEDVDGNVYLDAQAGVATASTGHCHPAVSSAIAAQAQELIHICGTDFHYAGYGAVCERLNSLASRLSSQGAGAITWQTFLTNSGTEAVEAALKLARHHTERTAIIAFRDGFHGRTYGSLSLTASKTKYRKHFGPFLPGVFHATWGDAASIENELFGHLVAPEDVAAIVVEPLLGEGGYRLPPADFLPALRRMCDRHGILLVFDEVQSGMGRTGRMFAAEHYGIVPDVLVLAKGIASGMPLGAMMARREIMTWPAGSHGSTCAGNPVCCAAALATLNLLEGGLVENSARQGKTLMARLVRELTPKTGVEQTGVADVRGLGLMIGVEFDSHARADAVANLCFRRGLLVLECGEKAIRISPPLTVTDGQVETIAAVFVAACRDVFRDHANATP
jgi:4-aminobutyrate aminotransferase